jgi:hypothetical protein
MFGIWMSEITHEVSGTLSDCKNACAEGKAYATNPSDRISLIVPIRHDSSSSMIEMTGASVKRLVHLSALPKRQHVAAAAAPT